MPSSITTPALQYPSGIGSSSLLKTASTVGIRPSARILSKTCLTFYGRCRAFSIQPALPKSTSIRSVPADTNVRDVRIRRCPRPTAGAGTSTISVAPVLRFWRICFMRIQSRGAEDPEDLQNVKFKALPSKAF